MRATIPSRFRLFNPVHPHHPHPRITAILFAVLFAAAATSGIAQQPAASPAPSKAPAAQKKAPERRKPVAAHAAAPAPAPAPVVPEPPKPPDWPVNDRPTAATVIWNSQGLRIEASNSSLQQILKDISTLTGAKIQGLASDQRIYGTYGPDSARQVLAQLLDGSGYNVLMIGDQGQGTPRQIVLSTQARAEPTQQAAANQNPQADENADADDQPQPDAQPQPQPPARNGFAPGAPPRSPQQILQEMQQRQQRSNPQL
jgi:hypothetical protein